MRRDLTHHLIKEEVHHVNSGAGLVMVKDSYQHLVAGDKVLIKGHQWHNIKNNGDE
ncbi:MAG: mannose-6-phosphate isomerase-like protein (cupin superfamily) [Candidatus Azotimanducaceae bacterium]|jgi:mannose-6-phosphate isomerase-like protein (cupin superfamily)